MTFETRSLSYGNLHVSAPTTKWYKPNGGSWSPISTIDVNVSQDYYSHRGENIDDFHKRKSRGDLLPITHWNQREIKGEVTVAKNTLTDPYGNESYFSSPRPLTSVWELGEDVVLEYNEIGRELYSRGNSHLQQSAANLYKESWDALTFTTEFWKTVRMFYRIYPRLIELIMRGRLDKLWLEGRYGWRILQYDIEDITKSIQKLRRSSREHKFASQRAGSSFGRVYVNEHTYSDAAGTVVFEVTDSFDVSVRGFTIADIKPPLVSWNPILTTWELVTFSFVVDWIINIGQWLAYLSFMSWRGESRQAWGTKISVERTCIARDVQWAAGWSGDRSFSSKTTMKRTTRTPVSTIPKLPQLGRELNAAQLLDIVYLLKSLIRSK